jgi:homocitrate synthase NifV
MLYELRLATDLELEFHGHNDLGMAVGNTVTALLSGANAASVTVNGLGERAGNAALEEVVLAMRHAAAVDLGVRTEALAALSERVAAASGRRLPVDKPVTGEGVFRHESGIHCRALAEDRSSYEAFSPGEVGRTQLPPVVGRHSGSASLAEAARSCGLELDREEAAVLLPRVRGEAEALGRGLSTAELRAIIEAGRYASREACA